MLSLTVKTYTEANLRDESAPDGHLYSQYQVFTLTAKTYKKDLLKDGSAPDSHSDRLYQVLSLTVKTYTEALLKDESAPDGHSYGYTGSSPWRLSVTLALINLFLFFTLECFREMMWKQVFMWDTYTIHYTMHILVYTCIWLNTHTCILTLYHTPTTLVSTSTSWRGEG